jgi:hypothetical protein
VSAHFCHHHDTECAGGGESLRHELMKHGIAELLRIQQGVEVLVEHPLEGNANVVPDLTVRFDTGKTYYVEVVVTHAPEPATIEALGLGLFVVNARYCDFDDIRENMLAPALTVYHLLQHHRADVELDGGILDSVRVVTPFWMREQRAIQNHNRLFGRHLDQLSQFEWKAVPGDESEDGEEPDMQWQDVQIGTEKQVIEVPERVSEVRPNEFLGNVPDYQPVRGPFGTTTWEVVGKKPTFGPKEVWFDIKIEREVEVPVTEKQLVQVGMKPILVSIPASWELWERRGYHRTKVLHAEVDPDPSLSLVDAALDVPHDKVVTSLRASLSVTAQARLAADLQEVENTCRRILGALWYGGPIWGAANPRRPLLPSLVFNTWTEFNSALPDRVNPLDRLARARNATMVHRALESNELTEARRAGVERSLRAWAAQHKDGVEADYEQFMDEGIAEILEDSSDVFALLPEFIRATAREDAERRLREVFSITDADLAACRIPN